MQHSLLSLFVLVLCSVHQCLDTVGCITPKTVVWNMHKLTVVEFEPLLEAAMPCRLVQHTPSQQPFEIISLL